MKKETEFNTLSKSVGFTTKALGAIFKVSDDKVRNWISGRTDAPQEVILKLKEYKDWLGIIQSKNNPERPLHVLNPTYQEFYYEMMNAGIYLGTKHEYNAITNKLAEDINKTTWEICSDTIKLSKIEVLKNYNQKEIHACLGRYGFLNVQRQCIAENLATKPKYRKNDEKGLLLKAIEAVSKKY